MTFPNFSTYCGKIDRMEEKYSNVDWRELTDQIKTFTGLSFRKQCEAINAAGVVMEYERRFLPMRVRGTKPRPAEVEALLDYVERHHGPEVLARIEA